MADPKDRLRKAKLFGKNLQRLRVRAGLTQEGLAELAGISPRYVQAIEVGRYLPTVFNADSLRKAVKGTWDELLS